MKYKDIVSRIRKNGWYFLRSGGNHDIYTNGKDVVPIPRHKEINEMTAKGILKRTGS